MFSEVCPHCHDIQTESLLDIGIPGRTKARQRRNPLQKARQTQSRCRFHEPHQDSEWRAKYQDDIQDMIQDIQINSVSGLFFFFRRN